MVISDRERDVITQLKYRAPFEESVHLLLADNVLVFELTYMSIISK